MRKENFRVKSLLTCKCGRRIKANVANRKLIPPELCYKCWRAKEAGRSHYINFNPREVRIKSGGLLPHKDYSGQPKPLEEYRKYLKRCC